MKSGEHFDHTINDMNQIKELEKSGLSRTEIVRTLNMKDQRFRKLRRLIKSKMNPKGRATVIDKDFEKPPCGLNMTKCYTPCYQGRRGNCPVYTPKLFS